VRATATMSQDALRWLEIRDEPLFTLVLPFIEKMPDETAEILFDRICEAFEREKNAAMRGDQSGDGGARQLLLAVEMFVHGWYKKLPREWNAIGSKLRARKDPEWKEYQRLKEKFEGS